MTVNNNLTDFPDAKFPPLPDGSKNRYVMRYNHSKGGFDLVSPDGVVVEETKTVFPETFLEVMESEMNLEDITEIGDIDAGSFS